MADKEINIVEFLKLLNNYSQLEADQSSYDLSDKEKDKISKQVYRFTKDFKTEKLPLGLGSAGMGQAEDYANMERWSKGIKKALYLEGLDMTNPADIKKAQAYMSHAISITKGDEYAEKITGEDGWRDSELEDMMQDSSFNEDFLFKLNKIPRRTEGYTGPKQSLFLQDNIGYDDTSQGQFGVGEIVKKLKKSKYSKYFKDKSKYDFRNKDSVIQFLSDEVPSLKEEYITTGTIDLEKAEDDIILSMDTPKGYTPGEFVGTVENLAKQFQNGDKTMPLSVDDLHVLGDDVRNIELIIENNVPLVSELWEDTWNEDKTKITGKNMWAKDYSSRDNMLEYIRGLINSAHPKGQELLDKFNSTYLTDVEKKEDNEIINTGKVPVDQVDYIQEEPTPLPTGTHQDEEGNIYRKGTEGGWQVKYNKATREKGAPTVDQFGTPSFKMEYDYENDWTALDKEEYQQPNFENQLTPYTGDIEDLPSTTTEEGAPVTRGEQLMKGGASLLKGAQAALDYIGGPGAIVSYIMGKKGLKAAMKEIEPQKRAELSPVFMQHLRQSRELSKKGFHPDQARKIRKEMDGAYQIGLENAVRGSGGDRAKYLAQSGVLDAQRSSALLDYAVEDEKLQTKNADKYEKLMLFKENFDIERTEEDRAEDMARQVADKKAAAGFTSAAFTNLISGFGGSSSLTNQYSPANQLYGQMQNMFTKPKGTKE